MQNFEYVERVVNLIDPEKNIIYNMTTDEAISILRDGSAEELRKVDGQFAIMSVEGKKIKLARSIGRPIRYFIAKREAGPCLIVAEKMEEILAQLKVEGLEDQFNPAYTRMAPAHYVTEIMLIGCPDPNPEYTRFFTPMRNQHQADIQSIGVDYMTALYAEIKKYLQNVATEGPIGVSFSAGVDSGSVFLLTYHALLELGESPSRLKAFTLSIDGAGEDLKQAHDFLDRLGLAMFLEPIEVSSDELDWKEAIAITEDYKELDIQSATMNIALLRGIRKRYPNWKYMLDGDGGDENLKDYPIEENTELTIRSVLNNLMLYQEGWGVHAMKHSLTYSGGLSRGYMRTWAPANHFGFVGLSPYALPNVIEVAEGVPFIDMTDWQHDKLYDLKGAIVSAGVKVITKYDMPIYPKKRFQHGAGTRSFAEDFFPKNQMVYRTEFQRMHL